MSTNPIDAQLCTLLYKSAVEFYDAGDDETGDGLSRAARRLEARSALLAECEKHLSEWLQEFGGCDHAVNVCTCAEQQLLLKVRTALNEGGA